MKEGNQFISSRREGALAGRFSLTMEGVPWVFCLGSIPDPLEKIRDTGRAEGVRGIMRWESGLFDPSFKHVRGVGAHKRPARQFAGFAKGGRAQRRRMAAICCLTVGARGPALNDCDMLRP